MKKFALLLLITCFCVLAGFAQTVTGSYQQTKGSTTFIATGSLTSTGTLFGTNWSGNTASPAISGTIPFIFYFNGTGYTSCYVNPNGYITFGANSTGTNYTPMSTPDASVTGVVSALSCNYLKSANAVTYGVSGTSPNRIYSIVWTTAGFGNAITGCTISFEINLYETTNRVEVVYSAPTQAAPTASLATRVGIQGASTTDYMGWTELATSTTTTSGTSPGNSWLLMKPGLADTASCILNKTATATAGYFPAANLTFDWTPNLNLLSPTNISHTGFTVNWQTVSGANGYIVELSNNSSGVPDITGDSVAVSAATSSYSFTGLTTGNTYYYKVTPTYASGGTVSKSVIYPIIMPVATPVTLTSGSFNYDMVANGGNTISKGSVNDTVTGANGLDHTGYNIASADFYYNSFTSVSSLPTGGSYKESASNGIIYQLAPYNQNNAYWFSAGTSGSPTDTLSFVTPVAATNVYVISNSGSAGTAGNTATFTIMFTDGTFQQFPSQAMNDWCTSGGTFTSIGRVGVGDPYSTCPVIFRNALALSTANYTKQIKSVACQMTAGAGYTALFGVTVAPTPTISFSTGSLTGFTASTCTPSASQLVTFSANHLINSTVNTTGVATLTAVAPAGYKICATAGGTYAKTVNYSSLNCALTASTLYVRLDTNVAGIYNGKIGFAGAAIVDSAFLPSIDSIALTGTLPGIVYKAAGATSYPVSISTSYYGHITTGLNSPIIVDSVIGYGLTSSITFTPANTDFKISTNGTSFSSSVTLTPTGGTITPGVAIYRRATPSILGVDTGSVIITGGISGCAQSIKDSVYGVLTCGTPSLPTTLTATSTTSTTTSIGFTPVGTTPDFYIVVRSYTPFSPGPSSDPILAHNYAVNDTFGNGRVIAINTGATAIPYAYTGLTPNATYYYTIVPFNGGPSGTCGDGPVYNTGTQLTGSMTTCAAAPTIAVVTGLSTSGFNLSWTPGTSGGAATVTDSVYVATDAAFTAPVAGYPLVTSGTSVSLTGLTVGTTYYYRIKALGSCNASTYVSGNTSTPTQTIANFYLQTKVTSGTYIPSSSFTSGSTTIYAAPWAGNAAGSATAATIPFSFYFNGTAYTTCYVNPNGYITFGAASTIANYTPLSAPTTGVTGTVSALGCNYLLSSSNPIVTGVSGTAPNRIFTIQWNTISYGLTVTALNTSFEINLYETSNKAEVVYSSTTGVAGTAANITAQVGIGTTASDVVGWADSAVSTNAYTTGGNQGINWANIKPIDSVYTFVTIDRSNAAYVPPAGLTFDWSPTQLLYSPSSISHTGFTINWQAVTGVSSYKVDVYTNPGLTTELTGYPVTVSSTTISQAVTGLTTGSTYYYKVTPVYSSGGFMTSSAVYPITMPVYTPVDLTSTSYNYDIIANGGNTVAGTQGITGSVNNMAGGTYGLDGGGYDLASADFYNASTVPSFPIGGSIIDTTTAGLGIVYQCAPYFQNNCLLFRSGSGSGTQTLTFANPVAATNVYFCVTSGSGSNTPTMTITFTDLTTQTLSTGSFVDWCGSTSSSFYRVIGRVKTNKGVDQYSACPGLYKITGAVNAANTTKLIKSIAISVGTATTYPAIFAVSVGQTPIITASAMTGFAATTCGTPSASQSTAISCNHLVAGTANTTGIGSITAYAPLGYKISTDGSTWVKSLTYNFANCTFSGTLYARLDTNVVGTWNGKIGFSGGNIPANSVDSIVVSGTVSGVAFKAAGATTYPTVMPTIALGAVNLSTPSSIVVDSVMGTGLTGNITITSSNHDIKLSLNGTTFDTAVTITVTGGAISPAVALYTQATPSALGVDTVRLSITGGAIGCIPSIKDSVYGANNCGSPSLPTALTFPTTLSTSTTVGFTPTGYADFYLLVKSTVPFVAGSYPVLGATYLVGNTFGNGTVVAVNSFTSPSPFAAVTGLTSGTTYYFTVVPYNGGAGGTCTGSTQYASGTQLTGSVTTCNLAAPTGIAVTANSTTGSAFSLSWTAASGATSYSVDVSTNSSFSGGAPSGSPFTTTGTSVNITGLLSGTTYFYRVSTIGACTSSPSTTASNTTFENNFTVTIDSGFNADIVADSTTDPTTTTWFPVGATLGSGVATTSFDNAAPSGYVLIGSNYTFTTATNKLPAGGAFSASANSALPFKLGPYSNPAANVGGNALEMHNGSGYPSNGVLRLATPTKASQLYIAGICGSGSMSMTYCMNYTDGTSDSANTTVYTYPDWFQATNVGSTPVGNTLYGISAIGRIPCTTSPGAGGVNSLSPTIFYANVPVSAAGQTKTIRSVRATFSTSPSYIAPSNSNAGYLALMAISARGGLLQASTSSLASFGAIASCGGSSSVQSFTISGSTLYPTGGTIVAHAPAGFKVSADGVSFDTVASITYSGNAMTSVPVYVKFFPTVAGSASGNVTFTGGTVNAPPSVAVSGTGSGIVVRPSSVAAFGPVGVGSLSTPIVDTLIGTSLTPGTVTISTSNPDFQISPDGTTWYTSSFPITVSTSLNVPLYIALDPAATGADSAVITVTSTVGCNPTIKATGSGAANCFTPSAATGMTFTSTTNTSTQLNFTPGSTSDGYIVLFGSSPFTGTLTDGVNYTVGSTIAGGGTVQGIYTGASSPISLTSGTVAIIGNTLYYVTLVPFNGGPTGSCASGPKYAAPYLQGSFTTCAGAVSALTPTSITGTGISISWSAPTTGTANTIYYVLDISTSATFASAVSTYVTTATSYTVTPLFGATTYYYRLHDSTAACVSGYTSTYNNTTPCGYVAMPYSEGFESITSNNQYPNCISGTSQAFCNQTYAAASGSLVPHNGTKFAAFYYFNSASSGYCNDWYFTPQFNFIAGNSYVVSFWYAQTVSGAFTTVKAAYGTSNTAAAMVNPLGSIISSPTNTSYVQVSDTFTAAATGFYNVGIFAQNPGTFGYLLLDDISVQANPNLTATPSSLNFGNVNVGFTGTSSFVLAGNTLTAGPIVVTAPTGYLVSTSPTSAFTSSLSLSYTGGSITADTVYVQFAPSAAGVASGNVTCVGGGASRNVAVTGTGVVPTLTLTPTSINMATITYGSTSPAHTFTVSGTFLTGYPGNITLASTDTAEYHISNDGGATWHTSVTVPYTSGTLSATTISVEYTPAGIGASPAAYITTSGGGVSTPPSDTLTGSGAAGPCPTPDVPTGLSFTGTNATSTSLSFSDAVAPSGYIVVASTGTLTGVPTTGVYYSVGNTIGSGTVVATSTSTTISVTGLTANTLYTLTVFPFDSGALCAGPVYNTSTPLNGTVTTCPGTPGTPVVSSITSSGCVLTWTAPAGGSASALTYSIDVSTNNTFTAPVTGSPFTSTSLSASLNPLPSNATLYFRVKAVGTCTGLPSSSVSATTNTYVYTTMPISSGFNFDVIANGTSTASVSTNNGTTGFNGGYVWLSTDYNNGGHTPTSGVVGSGTVTTTYALPASGAFTSANTPGLPYQLASYTVNNFLVVPLTTASIANTLTFATPAYANQLYIIGCTGNGAATGVQIKVTFADGTSQTATGISTFGDWYGGSSIAIGSVGRLLLSSGVAEGTNAGPNLYEYALTINDTNMTKKINNIVVTTGTTPIPAGTLGIAAVSARAGVLYASTTSLPDFGSSYMGCGSSSQTFTINGSSLFPTAGNIVAKAPTGFQVSNNGTTWGATATFTYAGNALPNTTVYVRLNPTAGGVASGNVTFTGGTANTSPSIAVSGTGMQGVIAGPTSVCATASITLSDTVTGGSWSSSNTSTATVDATTGVVTGVNVAGGTVYIRHSYSCGAAYDSLLVTINPFPTVTPIVNPATDSVLVGYTLPLSESTGGGTWSSSNTSLATIDGSGVVTGVAIGIDTIRYAVTNSCGTTTVIKPIVVFKAPPAIFTVSPNKANPGATVTITGKRFNATAANNIVYFGATRATVSSASTTSLTVTVPADATQAPITILNTDWNMVGYEDSMFTPEFTNTAFKNDTLAFRNYVTLTTTSAASRPYTGAIGDVDGDGKADLVVNNQDSSTVSIFLNNSTTGTISSSSFTLYSKISVGGTPNNVKLADIDGDGKLDVVVALNNVATTSVVVLLNTTTTVGAPAFSTNNISVGTFSAVAAVTDFDGDGKSDIAVSLPAGAIGVLRNTSTVGSVSFASPVSVITGSVPSGVCFADLDNDGKVDVVAVNSGLTAGPSYTGSTITAARNTSTLGSISFASPSTLTTGSGPVDVVAADIDGDGKRDLLTTNINTGTFSVLKNNSSSGSLSFGAHVDFSTGSLANGTTGIAVADINGDGKLDVVVSNAVASTVSMFRNTATSGTINSGSFATHLDFASGANPATVTIGDLDGDAYPDVVVGNSGANSISIIKNNPQPQIGPITGTTTVCATLTTTLSNSVSGGTWSASTPSVATIDATTGVVTAISAGTDTITYAVIAGGDTSRRTAIVTVNPQPVAGSITGLPSICVGSTLTLTDTASGGTWSSSATIVATVDASGVVTPVAAGTTVISYSVTNSCGTSIAKDTITVNPLPNAGSITGLPSICMGSILTLTDAAPGGTWSSSATSVATVDASGIVTPVAVGTTVISYTVTNVCGTAIARDTITVNPLPNAGSITGLSSICTGYTLTLSDTASGGTWSSSATGVATVDVSGVVTPVSAGTTIISYSVTNVCGTAIARDTITVNTTPAITPGATPVVCGGTTSASLSYSGAIGSPTTYSITYDAAAHTAGFLDVSGFALSAGSISLVVPAGASPATYNGTLTVSNGSCVSGSYAIHVTVVTYPAASITSAVVPCSGTATSITFTGTSGYTIGYKVDGTALTTATLTGGTFILPTVTMTTSHDYKLVFVGNLYCADTLNIDTVLVPIPMQWTGTTDTNWNNAANWSCGIVPVDSIDAAIPAGTPFAPSLAASGTAATRGLTIASGVILNLYPSSVLTVKGKLTNNTSITGAGILSMGGTVAQHMSGTGNFTNLDINNALGVTIDTGSLLTVKNVLSVSAGTFATADSFILGSDSVATARISAMTAPGAAVSGNVRVQQYIPGGRRAYRFWAHPFTGDIALSQIEKYIDITGHGGTANGFTHTITDAPSCYRYNPLVGNSTMGYDPGWRPFTSTLTTSDTNGFHQFQGIRLFIRGTKDSGLNGLPYTPLATSITMVGNVNQGSLTVHLVKSGTDTTKDYNQIGNPYPSPVDIGTVAHNAYTSSQMRGSSIYLWNPYLGGPMGNGNWIAIPVDAGVPYNIQANTSFQIRADHNGAALNFAETNKANSGDVSILREIPQYISLNIYDVNYNMYDMLYVRFKSEATDLEDNKYDAAKPSSPANLNFYSMSAEGNKLSVDSRPYEAGKVIPLGISSTVAQDFIIKTDGYAAPAGAKVYLHDMLLNTYTLLQKGTEYRFSITTDKSTQGDKRFELGVDPVAAVAVNKPLQVTMQPNPASDEVNISFTSGIKGDVNIRMMDLSGVNVYNTALGLQQNGSVNVPLSNFASGIYMVELTQGDQKVVQRLIKE